MIGAPDLLQHLRTTGFSVTAAEGGGIRVAPAGALSADQRQAIRDLKPALLALLAATPATNPVPEALALWPEQVLTWPDSKRAGNGCYAGAGLRRRRMRWLSG